LCQNIYECMYFLQWYVLFSPDIASQFRDELKQHLSTLSDDGPTVATGNDMETDSTSVSKSQSRRIQLSLLVSCFSASFWYKNIITQLFLLLGNSKYREENHQVQVRAKKIENRRNQSQK